MNDVKISKKEKNEKMAPFGAINLSNQNLSENKEFYDHITTNIVNICPNRPKFSYS